MNFSAAIRFPFRGPKPWANIALMAVCQLIPIVGPIVAMGYGTLVEKSLLRDPAGDIPAFDFGNFSKYLERGVAPFLVGLVMSLVYLPVFFGVVFGTILCVTLLISFAHDSTAMLAAGISMLVILCILFVVLMPVVLLPFGLRAMMLGKFGLAFDFRWAKDFIRRVGGSVILANIVMQLIAIPLILAGECLFFVGIYFAIAIFIMMQWHIQVQLYQLYLDRGGAPLPIRDEPLPPAFPVLPPPLPPMPKI